MKPSTPRSPFVQPHPSVDRLPRPSFTPPSSPLALPAPDELRLLPRKSKRSLPRRPIIVFVFCLILTLVAFGLRILSATSTPLSSASSSTSPSPTPTPLKTYQNTSYNLELVYPETTPLEIVSLPDSHRLELIFAKNTRGQFTLTASKDFSPADASNFHDTTPISRRVVAGQLWNVYYLPDYPLTPGTDPPPDAATNSLFALRLVQNEILYTLVFFNQDDTTPAQDDIISTLKFLDTTPTPVPGWPDHTDPWGFSFQAPSRWQINTQVVPQGQTLQPANLYDINATDGDRKLIYLTYSDWQIKVIIAQQFTPQKCGGFGPITGELLQYYHPLTVLGTPAARLSLETGKYWTAADTPEPFPQPILFHRSPGETSATFPNPDTDDSIVYKFCLETNNPSLSFDFTYHSPVFTRDNLDNHRLDLDILQEMDQILSTFQLTPSSEPSQ